MSLPKTVCLESSQWLFPILKEYRALGLLRNLQKQGQIPKPEPIDILHLRSHADDSAFRDEKLSPTQCRRLIYRQLIPLCTMNKSTSGLMPGDVGKIPQLLLFGYISICRAFSGFLWKMSQRSVSTMDLVSSCGFWCESFYNVSYTPTPTNHNYDIKPQSHTQFLLSSRSRSSA